MSASTLVHADLWHTGIVVDDLPAAMAELADALGVTWTEGGAEVCLITDDGVQTVTTSYALSTTGPHHVEVTQAIPGTLWSVASPGHAHHLGYWVDDMTAASSALEAAGSPRIATVAMSEDAPPMCAYHRTASGLHVEVVARALQKVLLPKESR